MKNYDERTEEIRSKLKNAKRKRRITLSVVSLCCCVALLVGIVLIPKGRDGSEIKNYAVKSGPQGYEPLVARLSVLLKPILFDEELGMPEVDLPTMAPGAAMPEVDLPTMAPGAAMPDEDTNDGSGRYEEVTDNQVAGVTEADLFKRSDKHIFYLRGKTLTAYSIAGEDSEELDSCEIGSELGEQYRVYDYELEMYLSADCRTVTVIGKCFDEEAQKLYLYLESLDVSDPENIQVRGNQFLTGSYNTSRLIGNDLYVISRLYVPYNADLTDESTFLPGFGTPDEMEYLPMDRICLPEDADSAMYTVVSRLSCDELEVLDSMAVLSADGQVYVSHENIYLTREIWERTTEGNQVTSQTVTEITRINIQGSELINKGSVRVDGAVNNQYNLDEHNGILRVVTTLSGSRYTEYTDGMSTSMMPAESITNASLYCIDLLDNSIRAKVERFAPDGESVRSVRFDGDKAYVCTSIMLMDPVFFFDLSDLDHITVKDTGTIDGFSMSLVDFADGFLMGIGYGQDFSTLKVELYREGATSVESHCAYERQNCTFAEEYKTYLIDRKNQLVGLGVYDYATGDETRYVLLHFDGYELHKVLDAAYEGTPYQTRAVYIDGYLYLFGDGFDVHQVG